MTRAAVNVTGVIEANAISSTAGGRIVLDSSSYGTTTVSGQVNASGNGAGQQGGSIAALGERVAILGQAQLTASGDAGGGQVLVGGNFHGAGAERNASQVIVQQGTNINADAALQAVFGGKKTVSMFEMTKLVSKNVK